MTDWETLFTKQQVMWKYPGHGPHAAYALWNKHSDFYFNSNYIIFNPPLLKEATLALFNAVRAKLKAKPNWVVTYPPFGRIWTADTCPLCANGSTALPARQVWQQLIGDIER